MLTKQTMQPTIFSKFHFGNRPKGKKKSNLIKHQQRIRH